MKLNERPMGDVLEFFDHIRVPLSSLERETRQGPYRYYGAQSVIDHIDAYLFDGEYVLIAEDGANLVTRNEPIAFLVDGQFWVNNHAHIVRGKSQIADNYFITAWLNNSNIAGFVTGVAQPKLSQQNLKQIKIALPPYDVQCAVTQVLSAYDDLIENNRRRMALLEESARLLYQEWFVRLRFPGHEHVRIKNGVPEGWEAAQLGERVSLNYGKALKADTRVEGVFPVYGSSGIVGSHNAALAKGPGIILGRKGNVGSVFWSSKDFYAIDTVYFIKAEESNLYLYYALKHMHFISTDVAVPGLNRDLAYSRPLLVPSNSVLRLFLDTVSPIHQQLDKLDETNQKLRAARNLLLPRLMSGEVVV
ncbi:MAG: restriction endonuclease subunit S [Pirellulaceae bacterium]